MASRTVCRTCAAQRTASRAQQIGAIATLSATWAVHYGARQRRGYAQATSSAPHDSAGQTLPKGQGMHEQRKAAAEARLRSVLQILGFTAAALGIGTLFWVKEQQNQPSRNPGGLYPDRFTPLLVTLNQLCTSSLQSEVGDSHHRHLELALGPESTPLLPEQTRDDGLEIFSIYIKQPDIQIERAYTPLYAPRDATSSGKIDLLVKKYENGEMGKYIHSRLIGQPLEARGWLKTWDAGWHPYEIDHIYFLVAGTGITPAYQLINSVLSNRPSSSTRFTLFYSAPQPASFLLLPELEQLREANPDRLRVELWAEDASSLKAHRLGVWPTIARELRGMVVREGRIALPDLRKRLCRTEPGSVVLVCGPDGFVSAIAGPLSRDGQSQGPLQGYLADLGSSPYQVHKL
ncbi:ferredoxin reductase-like protein [Tilletiaria anomala UBC 951]|uniref:Ferredoxin reductase-like protein n=1 Tax=Tilletiaria anomala (strain ATCC 24038 / CBS 436.72 / UBC 951) TaxID=1037660 RepID=A0A066V2W5_TILAU|nr:ferredoxin reductase-like protein [Tilletiaria anomala UBC 951]KDN36047.1 ferredoxin reductase-like protein [Tilletiaria anomala UBC 951]